MCSGVSFACVHWTHYQYKWTNELLIRQASKLSSKRNLLLFMNKHACMRLYNADDSFGVCRGRKKKKTMTTTTRRRRRESRWKRKKPHEQRSREMEWKQHIKREQDEGNSSPTKTVWLLTTSQSMCEDATTKMP